MDEPPSPSPEPLYLKPYLRAAEKHGNGFGSLLWASPTTQSARFDAMTRLVDFNGLRVLDCGCGRADFMDFLIARGIAPREYIGLEAVPQLASAALAKSHPNSAIFKSDFVREPHQMALDADALLFSGSLNTLNSSAFYATLHIAYGAARKVVVFNFLSSILLASAKWLTWHRRADVEQFARSLSRRVEVLDDYLEGDCTMAVWKD